MEQIKLPNVSMIRRNALLHFLPLVKLTMTAFVEGEDEIVVGDILTCKLRVDYHNLD